MTVFWEDVEKVLADWCAGTATQGEVRAALSTLCGIKIVDRAQYKIVTLYDSNDRSSNDGDHSRNDCDGVPLPDLGEMPTRRIDSAPTPLPPPAPGMKTPVPTSFDTMSFFNPLPPASPSPACEHGGLQRWCNNIRAVDGRLCTDVQVKIDLADLANTRRKGTTPSS